MVLNPLLSRHLSLPAAMASVQTIRPWPIRWKKMDRYQPNGVHTVHNSVPTRPGEIRNPDSKVHGANMGPARGRQDAGGTHVGHVNLAIWELGWMNAVLSYKYSLRVRLTSKHIGADYAKSQLFCLKIIFPTESMAIFQYSLFLQKYLEVRSYGPVVDPTLWRKWINVNDTWINI